MPPKGPYLNGSRYWANIPGLGRKPLAPRGDTMATKDHDVAMKVYSDWITRIERQKRGLDLGIAEERNIAPAAFALKHLESLTQRRRSARGLTGKEPLPKSDLEALAKTRYALMTCIEQMAADGITVLRQFDNDAATRLINAMLTVVQTSAGPAKSKRPQRDLKPASARRMLMELSRMLTSAERAGYLPRNPLRGHEEMPSGRRKTALDKTAYLKRKEVVKLLDAVRYSSKNPWAIEQAFTLFYTGARLSEVNALLVSDFHMDPKDRRVTVRERAGAGGGTSDVKTEGAQRDIPLWPVLEEVMRASFAQVPRNPEGLAFPAPGTENLPLNRQRQMQRLRYSLKSAGERAKIKKACGHHHIARHSYISERQTMVEVDALGVERSVATSYIAEEVGHATEEQIRLTYGHLPRSGVHQTLLHYGEESPVARMKAYREKRQRLVRRRARHEARQGRPRPPAQP